MTATRTPAEIAAIIGLGKAHKSADFFAQLADDAGNWSGNPWFQGNVDFGTSTQGCVKKLVEAGLINPTSGGRDGAYADFTDAGVIAAGLIGIDLTYAYDKPEGWKLVTDDDTDESPEIAAVVEPAPVAAEPANDDAVLFTITTDGHGGLSLRTANGDVIDAIQLPPALRGQAGIVNRTAARMLCRSIAN